MIRMSVHGECVFWILRCMWTTSAPPSSVSCCRSIPDSRDNAAFPQKAGLSMAGMWVQSASLCRADDILGRGEACSWKADGHFRPAAAITARFCFCKRTRRRPRVCPAQKGRGRGGILIPKSPGHLWGADVARHARFRHARWGRWDDALFPGDVRAGVGTLRRLVHDFPAILVR